MNDIDLVVLWVDGSDPVWLDEKNKYSKFKANPGYYQDWGWMKYWFRCVEQNLPWIRNVFFVTYGHLPKWLNVNHPKLKIINHKDFIPQEYLPTFNQVAISLNLHKIKDLSETFIYAEDDIFFIGKQSPEDFFSNDGLPKDYLWLKPITEQFHGDFAHLILNNVLMIKKHFDIQELSNRKELLYSDLYPKALIDDNRRYETLKFIPGFKESHLAYSFTKSTLKNLWEVEYAELYKSCMHKFRSITDINTMVLRNWQLASGNFVPYYQNGRYFTTTADPNLKQLILSEDTKMLCINESEKQGYTKEKANEIISYFEQSFPTPSSFEI